MIVRIRPLLDVNTISKAVALAGETDDHLIKDFENVFGSYIGASNAIAVDRGRSALLLALKILDIKRGDEVLVQSHIFHVVVDAVLEVGAKPVLADSSMVDFNVSSHAIEREVTPRTKAIIITHLGIPCDIEEISDIARRHNCYMIENCAHTLGAGYKGKNVGTFGDISFYSFDVDKPITTGDGGMLVINNQGLVTKAHEILSNYKKTPLEKEKEIVYGLLLHHFATSEEIYPEKGFLPVDFGKNAVKNDPQLLSLMEKTMAAGADKDIREHVFPYMQQEKMLNTERSLLEKMLSRVYCKARAMLGMVNIQKIDSSHLLMNSLRSAVGIECMKNFDTARDIRNSNTQYYIDHLDKSAFKQPQIAEGKTPAFIRYTVLNNTKYENFDITGKAREHGFEIGIFNCSAPIHLCYPYNKLLSFDRNRLSNSEQIGKRLLSLPVHPYVDESALKKIVQFLNNLGCSA